MNIVKVLMIAFFLVAAIGCNKNSVDATGDAISKALIIEGAELKRGNPPIPGGEGAPKFFISKNRLNVISKVSFTLPFEVEGDFVGLYLQVVGASSYFDIPLASINEGQTNQSTGLFGLLNFFDLPAFRIAGNNESNSSEFEVSINLNNFPDVGDFCAIACVYDAENNVSNPVEICIVIDSWGGNSEVVGEWKILSVDFYIDDNLQDSKEFAYGLVEESFACSETEECSSFYSYSTINIGVAGVFENHFIDSTTSSSCSFNCTKEKSNIGNWSYNSFSGELAFIAFSSDGVENNPPLIVISTIESLEDNIFVGKQDFGGGSYTILTMERLE